MKKILFTVITIFFTLIAFSQTYTFTGNGYWTVAANWSNNTIPPATLPSGDTILIEPGVGDSCVLNTPQTISSGAFLVVSPNANFIVSGGLTINNSTNVNDSIYIDKIYAVPSSATETSLIWAYNYDNLKRVTSMTLDYSYTPGTGIQYFYYYNNADTLPFKSIRYETFGQTDTTIVFHSYDSFGKIIQDSVLRFGNTTIRAYSYNSNMAFSEIDDPNNIYRILKDTAILNANGDISSSKRYGINPNNGEWELLSISNFTYESNKSPFAILSNFKTFGVFPTGETPYFELPHLYVLSSQNETNSISGGIPQNYSFNYTNIYTADGRLKEVLVVNPNDPLDGGKFIFTYRAL